MAQTSGVPAVRKVHAPGGRSGRCHGSPRSRTAASSETNADLGGASASFITYIPAVFPPKYRKNRGKGRGSIRAGTQSRFGDRRRDPFHQRQDLLIADDPCFKRTGLTAPPVSPTPQSVPRLPSAAGERSRFAFGKGRPKLCDMGPPATPHQAIPSFPATVMPSVPMRDHRVIRKSPPLPPFFRWNASAVRPGSSDPGLVPCYGNFPPGQGAGFFIA